MSPLSRRQGSCPAGRINDQKNNNNMNNNNNDDDDDDDEGERGGEVAKNSYLQLP